MPNDCGDETCLPNARYKAQRLYPVCIRIGCTDNGGVSATHRGYIAYVTDSAHTRYYFQPLIGSECMTDQSEKPPEDPVTPVSSEETRAAFMVPAPFCNKFTLHVAALQGRVTFLEVMPDGTPIARAAASLPVQDLLALADVIQKVVKQHLERTGVKIEFVPPSNA